MAELFAYPPANEDARLFRERWLSEHTMPEKPTPKQRRAAWQPPAGAHDLQVGPTAAGGVHRRYWLMP